MPKNLTSQQQVIDSLPAHLRPFVAYQDYNLYTPRDHAVWRFLLHQLRSNLASSAQATYLEGLERTGISLEAIPRIEHINACLNELDWKAVVVDGFLPPAIFMEFQALRVLVIAVDMRSFEHMLYTPAPDIVHESAGHAPFLIDIDYAEFLQRFGELGMRAISNQADLNVYEAIRNLSIVKATASSSAADVELATQRLDTALAENSVPSEAALLTRLHWWTVEYGLVGTLSNYSIFGAGLLSSLGESTSCLDDDLVTKLPLTVDAINTSYDITSEQPQLFVTESCRHLSQILEEFGRKMACSQGGTDALNTAIKAATVCTIETNSGLQIAGVVSRAVTDAVGNTVYFNTQGATQLAFEKNELEGQGRSHHPHGFGSPLGRLIGLERCLSDYTVDELKRHQIELDKPCTLNYLSGIKVSGKLVQIVRRRQKNILLTFKHCTVTNALGEVLFDPDWGIYDMAVGDSVISVQGGSADQDTFPLFAAPSNNTAVETGVDAHSQNQFKFYAELRTLREHQASADRVETLIHSISELHNPDWLLLYECWELAEQLKLHCASSLRQQLEQIKESSDSTEATLISYGLARSHAH